MVGVDFDFDFAEVYRYDDDYDEYLRDKVILIEMEIHSSSSPP